MRKIMLAALLLVFTAAAGQPRRVTNMDAGWRFHQGDVMDAEAATYDDMDWRKLDVPHDWSIEGDNLRENPGGGSIGFFPTGGHCRGVFYWEPQCMPGGYKLGAFDSKGTPTAIMNGFIEHNK